MVTLLNKLLPHFGILCYYFEMVGHGFQIAMEALSN